MRQLIISTLMAIAAISSVSTADAAVVRCNTSPTGWCNVVPAAGPMQRRPSLVIAPRIQFGGAQQVSAYGYRQSGVVETATVQTVDPRGEAPVYQGAVREGGCTDPNAVFINKEVGCSKRVTDPAVMEKYRGKISDICGDFHGDKTVPLQDGGRAHYMCP